jgi:hypothetical protein
MHVSRESAEDWHRRSSPPENELPAATGIGAVLGRTGDAAVGIGHVEAYSTGFSFTLAVRLRESIAGGRLFALISSRPHHDVAVPLGDRLLLGIEYADGSRTSTLDDMWPPGPVGPGLRLSQQSGGGGDRNVDQGYWLSPLPPDGPVTFVLAWPRFGIAETRTTVDGGLIRAAGARSELLWPPQPAEEPREPARPPRPESGWFADPPA